jgi:SM-20-related protein
MQVHAIQRSIPVPAVGEARIIDDYVPESIKRSINDLVRRPIWGFGWKSSVTNDDFGFWHARFAGGGTDSIENCEPELLDNVAAAPVAALWRHLSAGFLAGHVPVRVYANAHTYGVEGYIHRDSDREDHFTTIYYAHDQWEANWAGETTFFSPIHGNITMAVHPSPGRLVFFRGVTAHVGRSPSRMCPDLRVAVVIKTRLAAP